MISRRLLITASGAGVGALCLSGLLAACSKTQPPRYAARYLGNHFSLFARDAIYTTVTPSKGGPAALNVFNTYLNPGDEIEILDPIPQEFSVGTKLIAMERVRDGQQGYCSIETIVAECAPKNLAYIPFGNSYLLPTQSGSREEAVSAVEKLNGNYLEYFSTDGGKSIHPVQIGVTALPALFYAVTSDCEPALRSAVVQAVERMFDLYVIPKARPIGGAVAWPYEFDWPVHWGITLRAPWYSGYANAVMALNAGLLSYITEDERYMDIARKAVRWLFLSVDDGGALYRSRGYEYIAEYPYSSAVPAIRVFDGEMKAVVSLFNLGVVMRDSKLVLRAYDLAKGLAEALPLMETSDGRILNARYPWMVTSPGYVASMKLWSQQLGAITKDMRFDEAAQRWRISKTVWG